MIRICFVCLGNICRSPTAEGVMRHLLEREGLADVVAIDSAGTGSWHVGEPPDRRATEAARSRRVTLSGKARKFDRGDFDRFEYVMAMDRSNQKELERLAPHEQAAAKIRLLREFDPSSPVGAEVPDPYYGEESGFDRVLDICEAGCRGLIDHLRREHGL